jgi:hypothetical protein
MFVGVVIFSSPWVFAGTKRFLGFGYLTMPEATEKVLDRIHKAAPNSKLINVDISTAEWFKEIAAWAIACGVPIYGVRPPDKSLRLISVQELMAVHPNLGATALISIDGRNVVYENLKIKRADLHIFMPRLVAMTNVH